MGLLTLSEAANALRVSASHIRRIRNGRFCDLPPLPVINIGRRVFMRPEALTAWLLDLEQRGIEGAYATGGFARRIDTDPIFRKEVGDL